MVELKRVVKCSNCGNESNFHLSCDMNITELLLNGRCTYCGNSIQINFNIVDAGGVLSKPKEEEKKLVNLDETLFEPEIPSDTIKNLIEE